MLRRLIVIAFAFPIASGAGALLLLLAALFDPAIRETGFVAAMNGIFYIFDEAMKHGDPANPLALFYAGARAVVVAVCVAPLALAATIGEALEVCEPVWYAGASGVLAGASPWIARAALGLDKTRTPTAIETRIALLFFLIGVFTGALYWLIAVAGRRREKLQ